MRHYETIKVGDCEYVVQQFPATKGIKVLTRLTKLIGKPLANAAGGMNGDVSEVLPKIVDALVEKLDESEVETLIKKDLLSSVLFNNVPVDQIFDVHFQGRMGDLFKLLFEVVKYQYADFFPVLAGGMVTAQASQESNAQTTSSGQSGESLPRKLPLSRK